MGKGSNGLHCYLGSNPTIIRITPIATNPAGFGRVLTKKPKSNGYGLGFIFKKYREA